MGKTLFYKTFNLPNTVYQDTFKLGYGCYNFNFVDSAGDGLSFWNNAAQGSGYVRFVKNPLNSPSTILKTFNPDFGNFLNFNFRTVSQVGIDEINDISTFISIYPLPASDKLNIQSEKIIIKRIQLISMAGRVVKTFYDNEIALGELNISEISSGMYLVNISSVDGNQCVKKLVVVK